MLKKESFTQALIRKASQSACTYKVAAMGFNKRGEMLGVYYNTHPVGKDAGKGKGLHAEMRLIRNHKSIKSMLLCRVGKGGDLLPIDPCPSCQRVIDKLGIKAYSIKG